MGLARPLSRLLQQETGRRLAVRYDGSAQVTLH